jgi:hypothetical protein
VEYEHPRLVPRYSFIVDIELTDVQSGIQISERTTTLSLYGCGVATLHPFPKGTIVRITLSHEGSCVLALGRVVYANPKVGMGVVFSRIEREDIHILEGWIAELVRIQIQK